MIGWMAPLRHRGAKVHGAHPLGGDAPAEELPARGVLTEAGQQIAAELRISPATVSRRTMRGRVDSLAWKLPDDLSEDEWIEAGIIG